MTVSAFERTLKYISYRINSNVPTGLIITENTAYNTVHKKLWHPKYSDKFHISARSRNPGGGRNDNILNPKSWDWENLSKIAIHSHNQALSKRAFFNAQTTSHITEIVSFSIFRPPCNNKRQITSIIIKQ